MFRNYLIAKRTYKPDFFLYENNKSMSKAIREKITEELGVEPVLINSALVSAQNRQRLYWTDIPGVTQPEDRGILLRDIIEGYETRAEKVPLSAPVTPQAFPIRPATNPTRAVRSGCVCFGSLYSPKCRWRIYGVHGKSPTLTAAAGMSGGNIPMWADISGESGNCRKNPSCEKQIYEVRNGALEIRGKQHFLRLADGYYIIRKLTVSECRSLQTIPKDYAFPVCKSQTLKMLGNGWTVDIISHILSFCPGIRTEPLEVLSMYDGMSCGRLALNNLGANVVRYYATEIDKYAIATTQANFPDTVQLGDAFQVRNLGWKPHKAA